MQQPDTLKATSRRGSGAARRTAACLLCALGAAAAPAAAQPQTSQINAYLTVATDARARGLSQLDGDTAVRVGLDYEHARGFFAGGVVGNVSYAIDAGRARPREELLELYTGYLWRGAEWGFTGSVGHYDYPDTAFDYDYTELAAVVDFRDRYFYRVAYTDDLLSLGYRALGHELGVSIALPADFELGASLGRLDARDDPLEYTHYNIGVSRLVGRFGLDLRRYGTSREVVGYLGSSAAEQWVFSLSYAIRPRP